MQDDLSRYCCQNAECADHGKRGLDQGLRSDFALEVLVL